MSDKVIIGQFGRVLGLRGDIKVRSFTEPPENILQYLAWQVKPTPNSDWRVVKIAKSTWRADELVVQIEGITDRDEAKRFTNLEIAVERSQLPPLKEGNFYWADLVGLTVIDTQGTKLGVVDSFFATGSNDVMVVIDEKNKEHCIPYMSNVVLKVDLERRTIEVDWELL